MRAKRPGRMVTVALLLTAWVVSVRGMAPDEAAGIPWGALPGAVKLSMRDRPGAMLREESTDHQTYVGGDLSGRPVTSRRFEFMDGRMTRLTVTFVYPPGSDARGAVADHLRDDLLALLARKYGPAKDQSSSDAFHLWQWVWPHPVVHGYTRQIRLTQNWHAGTLTLVYLDNEPVAPATPAPATPGPAATPDAPNEL